MGPWPDVQYYAPDFMKKSKRDDFLKWHSQQTGKTFDMAQELDAYCVSDVVLLRQSIMKFRRLFIDTTGVDPITKASTIASACSHVYRRNFLQPDTIPIIQEGIYYLNYFD